MVKEHNESLNQVLQHVDESRRGFLGKLLAGGVAVAAIPTMSELALGQAPGGKGKGGRSVSDPAELAKKWLKEFDKDGDGKLDESELTAALKSSQGAASGGKGGGKGGGSGKGGGKGGGSGKGAGKGTN